MRVTSYITNNLIEMSLGLVGLFSTYLLLKVEPLPSVLMPSFTFGAYTAHLLLSNINSEGDLIPIQWPVMYLFNFFVLYIVGILIRKFVLKR